MTLRLETASVLELRKVLDSSNPQHHAIIDESVSAMAASLEDDSAATSRPAGAKVKAERDRARSANPSISTGGERKSRASGSTTSWGRQQ